MDLCGGNSNIVWNFHSPKIGEERFPILTVRNIFQRGWFNVQLQPPTRRGKNSHHLSGPLKNSDAGFRRISEIWYQKPTETNLQMLLAIQGYPPGN